MSNIFSIEEFDIEEAREKFLTGYIENNFTNIFQYYHHLAVSTNWFISFSPITDVGRLNVPDITEMFQVDWSNTQSEYPVLCYTANETSIKAHFGGGYKKILFPRKH